MNLNLFATRTRRRILTFINNNTDVAISSIDRETKRLLEDLIKESVIESSRNFDSNNFALAYRQDIAKKVFTALRDRNAPGMTSGFAAELSDDLTRVFDDNTMVAFRNQGLFDAVPDTTTDAVDDAIQAVDADLSSPEIEAARLNNFPRELEDLAKDLHESNTTDYPTVNDAKVRISKAIEEDYIYIRLNDALYPSIQIDEISRNGDILTDFDELVPILQKFGKEKKYTIITFFDRESESAFYKDNESGSLQPARRSEITYEADFDYTLRHTKRVIFPEDNAEVQKRLALLMDLKEQTIADEVPLKPLINTDGSDGPLFTTNKRNHSTFESYLNVYRNPQVQAALDKAEGVFSWRILGSGPFNARLTSTSAPNYSTIHSLTLERKGIGELFKKILGLEEGSRYLELIKKQRYFMALEHRDVNGKVHIVNIAESDHPHNRPYRHDIGSADNVRTGKKTSISTSFISFDPIVTNGYYPNPMGGKVKQIKNGAVMRAVDWFRGLLAVADADGITLSNSPINPYVANIYQTGGFVFDTTETAILEPGDEIDDLQSSMFRIPNESNELQRGWMAKPAQKEFTFKLDVQDVLWGEPNVSGVATKNKFTDIRKSPRHMQMIALSKLPDKHSMNNPAWYKRINGQMLNIALGNEFDYDQLVQVMKDSDNTTGFVFPSSDAYNLKNAILESYEPKMMMNILFRTEGFVDSTGINIIDVPQEVADDIGITKASLADFGFDINRISDTDVIATGPLTQINDGKGFLSIFNNLILMANNEIRSEYNVRYLPDVIEELKSKYDDIDDELIRQGINRYIDNASLEVPDTTTTPDTPITPDTPTEPEPIGSRQLAQYTRNFGVEDTFNDLRDNSIVPSETAGTLYPEGSYQLETMGTGRITNYRSGQNQIDLIKALFEVEDNVINDVFTTTSHGFDTDKNMLTDKARHLFVRNLEYSIKNQLGTRSSENVLLSADVEFVGTESSTTDIFPVQYYEVAAIYTTTDADGTIKLHKDYSTIEVKTKQVAGSNSSYITSNVSFGDTQRVLLNTAFTQMMSELNVNIIQGIPDTGPVVGVESRMHPVGRLSQAMNIFEGRVSEANLTFGTREGDILRFTPMFSTSNEIQTRHNFMREELAQIQQQRPERRGTADLSPQPFYTSVDVNTFIVDIEQRLPDFYKLVDERIDGAVTMQIKLPPESAVPGDTARFIDVTKEKGISAQITRGRNIMRDLGITFDGEKFTNLPDTAVINSVTVLAPNQDFYNGVLESNLKQLIPDTDSFGDSVIDYENLEPYGRNQYDIRQSYNTVLVNDDNLPRIYSGYSLGQQTGFGQFNGVPFNANRVPVGLNPDKKTIRKLAKAFAQTKTGKTLGYAWKTIDIGETLIDVAFKKAKQAALAAGAVGLGGVAATAASVWAFYELTNLIVGAMQGIPELANVYKKRNEILANGEEWEKQIVEETFWQDYGPEILEIFEEVGERSPAEILGNKIWSFTLDNLTRQSQGEVFEESLIDDSEDLDIRQDLWDAQVPDDYKVQLMQDNIDYDKVLTGYYNNRPDANAFVNRTVELANNVYNGNR